MGGRGSSSASSRISGTSRKGEWVGTTSLDYMLGGDGGSFIYYDKKSGESSSVRFSSSLGAWQSGRADKPEITLHVEGRPKFDALSDTLETDLKSYVRKNPKKFVGKNASAEIFEENKRREQMMGNIWR